jgi:murein DD-endopeptidase MepM/ murein hydrolase activator NlpD
MGSRAACGACGAAVTVSGARARVTADGVELVCRDRCQPRPTLRHRLDDAPAARARRGPAALFVGGALVVGAVLAYRGTAAALAAPAAPPIRALPAGEDAPDAAPGGRLAHVSVASAEAAPPAALGRAFDATQDRTVELAWYHPLAGPRRLPTSGDRRFGAGRPGARPSECGEGHCGVDLGERVGEVVHAALPGMIEHVDRIGAARGGRVVVVRHAGGFTTYYFHLDRIHPSLVPGLEVAAGEPLGTLGRTGIQRSAPHLHFQVKRLVGGTEVFVDPEPMLRRAVVFDEPAGMPDEPAPATVASTSLDPVAASDDE